MKNFKEEDKYLIISIKIGNKEKIVNIGYKGILKYLDGVNFRYLNLVRYIVFLGYIFGWEVFIFVRYLTRLGYFFVKER